MLWINDKLCSIVIAAFFLEPIFCMACAATLDHTHITSPLTLSLKADKECPAEFSACALRAQGGSARADVGPSCQSDGSWVKENVEMNVLHISLCCQVWQTQQKHKEENKKILQTFHISLWVKDILRHPWPGFGQLQPKSFLALLHTRPRLGPSHFAFQCVCKSSKKFRRFTPDS